MNSVFCGVLRTKASLGIEGISKSKNNYVINYSNCRFNSSFSYTVQNNQADWYRIDNDLTNHLEWYQVKIDNNSSQKPLQHKKEIINYNRLFYATKPILNKDEGIGNVSSTSTESATPTESTTSTSYQFPPNSQAFSWLFTNSVDDKSFLDQVIRVDHAGEYGAQRIYEGQLAMISKSNPSYEIIDKMLNQEKKHLDVFENLLQEYRVRPTIFLPFWHMAGWFLGASTAALGTSTAMLCTVAIEEVIGEHYNSQLRHEYSRNGYTTI